MSVRNDHSIGVFPFVFANADTALKGEPLFDFRFGRRTADMTTDTPSCC
jgi:hypothetical protein